MTVVAVEPFVVGLSVLLVVLLSSVIALRPFVAVRSSFLARPSLVSRPSIKLVRTVVRSIVRPSHFAVRSISSRSTADRRSLSSLELVALVDGLVSLSGNRLDSSFLFLVLLVVQVFSTLGLSVDVLMCMLVWQCSESHLCLLFLLSLHDAFSVASSVVVIRGSLHR